jgi:hypothetical protein
MNYKEPMSKLQFDKERGFSESISVTFEFVRQEFIPLLKSLLIFTSIPAVVLGVLQAYYIKGSFNNLLNSIAMGQEDRLGILLEWLPWLLSLSFIALLMVSGITLSYMNLYYKRGFTPAQPDVWKDFVSKGGRLLALSIIWSLVAMAGTIFFVVPGIWLSVVMVLSFPILFFEDASIKESFKRSFFLIRSHWWQTLGIVLVVSIIQSVLSGILAIPTVVYGVIKGIKDADVNMAVSGDDSFIILFSVLSTIVESWLNALTAVACGFQFFSLREKKENNSILQRIDQVNEGNE